ncbi:MAG: hypothetical protein IJL59_01995 [Clostridia bacterium]|nr:hypothetical protein [Clostridia bacterium]
MDGFQICRRKKPFPWVAADESDYFEGEDWLLQKTNISDRSHDFMPLFCAAEAVLGIAVKNSLFE